jgi:hypothetical protein
MVKLIHNNLQEGQVLAKSIMDGCSMNEALEIIEGHRKDAIRLIFLLLSQHPLP